MRFTLVALALVAIVTAGPATAQEATQEWQEDTGLSTNVRFEVTITDEGAGALSTEKRVILTIGAEGFGRVRSVHLGEPPSDFVFQPTVNIDIGNPQQRVQIMDDGSIQAAVAIEYRPPYTPDVLPRPSGTELSTIRTFEDGVSVELAQFVEAASDRQTSIAVTATILDRGQ